MSPCVLSRATPSAANSSRYRRNASRSYRVDRRSRDAGTAPPDTLAPAPIHQRPARRRCESSHRHSSQKTPPAEVRRNTAGERPDQGRSLVLWSRPGLPGARPHRAATASTPGWRSRSALKTAFCDSRRSTVRLRRHRHPPPPGQTSARSQVDSRFPSRRTASLPPPIGEAAAPRKQAREACLRGALSFHPHSTSFPALAIPASALKLVQGAS